MKLWRRYRETLLANWHFGFTAFGGPPVQFQTFHKKFVLDLKWIDEHTFKEIFAISQALPGSASVKMLFTINAIHSGLPAGFIAFLLFALPGAIGMFALSIGISHVGNTLPAPVYALISGLNGATVGIIALSAIRLAQRSITDRLTRLLVALGGIAGMLYTALWYYPVIMAFAGLTTLAWDSKISRKWAKQTQRKVLVILKKKSAKSEDDGEDEEREDKGVELQDVEKGMSKSWTTETTLRPATSSDEQEKGKEMCDARPTTPPPPTHNASSRPESICFSPKTPPPTKSNSNNNSSATLPITHSTTTTTTPTPSISSSHPPPPQNPFSTFSTLSLKLAFLILGLFLLSFLAVIITHSVLAPSLSPRPYSIFSVLYLAGTIIFGGGPVVIPLLRDYIVTPGWVSPRDFLLGLAIIQAFPGPNFNFAVYLGSLAAVAHSAQLSAPGSAGTAASSTSSSGGGGSGGGNTATRAACALLAFLAIFTPGLVIVVGFMSLWRILRCRAWFLSVLRGVNAAAVGLVFTAVYKLWQIGDLTAASSGGGGNGGTGGGKATTSTGGRPLGTDPWLVGITATAFVGVAWFRVVPPCAILLGGAMGVGRWAVVR